MKKIILMTLPLFLFGCSSMPSLDGDNVSSNAGDGAHLETKLTMTDYTKFAEKVTNKMLSSEQVQKWGTKKPRLVLGKLLNNTDDENIRMQDSYDRISETLLASGLVSLVDKNAASFDYIIRSELSSTRQSGDNGQELAHYKLELKLYTRGDQFVGQWSDTIALGKVERRFI